MLYAETKLANFMTITVIFSVSPFLEFYGKCVFIGINFIIVDFIDVLALVILQ